MIFPITAVIFSWLPRTNRMGPRMGPWGTPIVKSKYFIQIKRIMKMNLKEYNHSQL